MTTVVAADGAAGALDAIGLDVATVERVLRGADAEAALCTAFDPPILAGLVRWGRTVRLLREELVVGRGWSHDNPRNLARTVHPDGWFALVPMTGDEWTGLDEGRPPSTKNAKGQATALAVDDNSGQLPLDYGERWRTRILLFHVTEDEIRAEVSVPYDMSDDGYITSWYERVLLPPFPRAGGVGAAGDADSGTGHDRERTGPDPQVAVHRR